MKEYALNHNISRPLVFKELPLKSWVLGSLGTTDTFTRLGSTVGIGYRLCREGCGIEG